MKKEIPKENIFRGVAGILFGLVVFCFFIYFLSQNKLIHHESENLIDRYWEIIFLANGSLVFIVAGLLNIKGFIKPFNSRHSDAYEKAKIDALFATICSPSILILAYLSFDIIDNFAIKIFVSSFFFPNGVGPS